MEQKYCTYCMYPMEGAVCLHCGKRQTQKALPHQLKPGTILNGNILIGGVLGQGGFGITYIGRNLGLNRRVAVKEYFPSQFYTRNNSVSNTILYTGSEDHAIYVQGKKRFIEEAQMLARLKGQAGIVEVWDCFEENDTAYYVMEYLDGMTLRQYVKQNGTFHPETLLEKLHPIMQALGKIHRNGLIHRDISPDNIILKKDGTMTLFDFGAARNVEEQRSLSIILKPGFAPYEQYCGDGSQGPWTDVYALCATIYYCITGIVPPDAASRIRNNTLKLPSELGIALAPGQESALCKGMSVLEEKRYQSMEALEQALWVGEQADGSMPEDEDPGTILQADDVITKLDGNLQKTELLYPLTPSDRKDRNRKKYRTNGERKAAKWLLLSAAIIIAAFAAVLFLPKFLSQSDIESNIEETSAPSETNSNIILQPEEGENTNTSVQEVQNEEANEESASGDIVLELPLVVESHKYLDGMVVTEEYEYDDEKNLIKITDYIESKYGKNVSAIYEFRYDAAGNVKTYLQRGDEDEEPYVVTQFTYDDQGNCLSIIEEESPFTCYTYEFSYLENGNLAKCDRYSDSGRVLRSSTVYSYDNNGSNLVNKEYQSESLSYKIEYEYNKYGDVIKTTKHSESGDETVTRAYQYADSNGQIKKYHIESENGEWLSISEYVVPYPRPELDPVLVYGYSKSYGKVELEFEYDRDGNCTSIIGIDQNGTMTYQATFKYNSYGQLVWESEYNADLGIDEWIEYIYESNEQ